MRCEDYLSMIEEYFDGEMSEESAALVSAHLSSCRACAATYKKLCEEQEFYEQNRPEAELGREAWAGVSARISRGRSEALPREHDRRRASLLSHLRAPQFSLPVTAALLLLAVGLTAGVMKYADSRRVAVVHRSEEVAPAREPLSPAPVRELGGGVQAGDAGERSSSTAKAVNTAAGNRAEVAASVRRGSFVAAASRATERGATRVGENARRRAVSPEELVREAEQKYIAAIQLLSRDVSRRRSRLDAETVASLDRTLAAVDRTIQGTRRAVREHPQDPVAVQYMLTAYAKKVELLREIAEY